MSIKTIANIILAFFFIALIQGASIAQDSGQNPKIKRLEEKIEMLEKENERRESVRSVAATAKIAMQYYKDAVDIYADNFNTIKWGAAIFISLFTAFIGGLAFLGYRRISDVTSPLITANAKLLEDVEKARNEHDQIRESLRNDDIEIKKLRKKLEEVGTDAEEKVRKIEEKAHTNVRNISHTFAAYVQLILYMKLDTDSPDSQLLRNAKHEARLVIDGFGETDPKIKGWSLSIYGTILYFEKRVDEALAAFQESLSHEPDNPNALYNFSCCLSLKGKIDDALENLDRAITIDPAFKGQAKNESDFDNLKNDARFKKLITD